MIDIQRVIAELNQLATFSSCEQPPPAVTRVVFSDEDLAAREYLHQLYRKAGLQVRVDSVGNTFARWVGQDDSLPVVATGSHMDAIPHAGMYDGTVGVIGGLEAIRSLQASGFQPLRSIELVMITSEEPTRFGIGCTGSRIMAGQLGPTELSRLVDEDGDDFLAVRRRAGFDGSIESAVVSPEYFHAWVELHIEQGPILENESIDIGIVTAIAAPATIDVRIIGEGGHAGGVMMRTRRDALCAAAEMITAIEHIAMAVAGDDLVATVGKIQVHPGAVNSIPNEVRFSIDLRDIDGQRRDACHRDIAARLNEIAQYRKVELDVRTLNADPPADASPAITAAIEQACQTGRSTHRSMVSRAYHDSLFISQKSAMGMIFIPCRDGVSHRPDEFSSPEQIRAGIDVLAKTLATLAGSR